MKKKEWKKEWPILGVSNLQKSVKYYSDKLLFELCNNDSATQLSTEAKMKLFDFFIILKEGTRGPVYDPKEYADEIIPNVSPTLWIPVPKPKSYFDILKSKGANIITKNRFLGYDWEGFYVLDNEDNKILFSRDYHGPYEPYFWLWEWEKTKQKWFRLW